MSALGQELTSASRSGMSALPLKADMLGVGINVCFVPTADFGTRIRDVCFASKAEVLRHECKDEGRGSGAGATENSFCVSSVHLVPHLGASHCFIAKVTQLPGPPSSIVSD